MGNEFTTQHASDRCVTLRGHSKSCDVNCVRFSSCNRFLVTASGDTTVRVWSVEKAFKFATSSFFKHNTPKTTLKHTKSVFSCAPNPSDFSKIFTGGLEDVIRMWDVEGGEEDACLVGHTGPVSAIVVSSTGNEVVTKGAEGDDRIIMWDIRSGEKCSVLSTRRKKDYSRLEKVVFGENSQVIAAGDGENRLAVWDVRGQKKVMTTAAADRGMEVHGLCLSPSEETIATADEYGMLRAFELKTAKLKYERTVHCRASYDICVRGTERLEKEANEEVSADDSFEWILSSSFDGKYAFTHVDSNKVQLNGEDNVLLSCDWTKDGRIIALSGWNGFVKCIRTDYSFSPEEVKLG